MRMLFVFLLMLCTIRSTGQTLEITPLTKGFYVYTTYMNISSGRFPSNGMYAVTDSGVVLFDTPWDTLCLMPLLDTIRSRHNKNVVLCVATHYHNDRTAGLEVLNKMGIPTYASAYTRDLCLQFKEKPPAFVFFTDTAFMIGKLRFSTFYPGPGHTPDNIVLWIDDERILYGGCFVKSTENSGLGNIADADLKAWPSGVKKLIGKYPDAAYVIPGHFGWGDKRALQHTLRLLRKAGRN